MISKFVIQGGCDFFFYFSKAWFSKTVRFQRLTVFSGDKYGNKTLISFDWLWDSKDHICYKLMTSQKPNLDGCSRLIDQIWLTRTADVICGHFVL